MQPPPATHDHFPERANRLAIQIAGALTCLPLLAATSLQDTAATRPVPIGPLSHVQLLGVTGGDRPTMRFALAGRRRALANDARRLAIFECPAGSMAPTGEPLAVLYLPLDVLPLDVLPLDVLPRKAWLEPVNWRVLESGSSTWLVTHDLHRGVTEIRDFATGEVQATIGGTRSFDDARVAGDVIEILGLAGSGPAGHSSYPSAIERIRWTIGTERIERDALLNVQASRDGPRSGAVAAFARESPGGPAAGTLVIATMSASSPVFHVFDAGSNEARRLAPVIERRGPSSLRLRVLQSQGKLRIALGMPQWDAHAGRVILVSADAGRPPELLADVLSNGMTSEELWSARERGQASIAFGQALDFVHDMDGDGIPEVAVSGPLMKGAVIEILSGATGKRLRRCTTWKTGLTRLGSSVSTSPCGRWVLAAGGATAWSDKSTPRGALLLIDTQE